MSGAKITFFGAAGEVTGSCALVDSGRGKVLVDCGMHQGADSDKRNFEPFGFSPADVDAVVLTHAHVDHSGRLPLLVKQGFKGKIWATDPTIELVSVLLADTAHLAAEDAEWKSRKNARRGLKPVQPLFTEEDVDKTLSHLSFVAYDDRVDIAPGISIRLRDSGHIIGSSMIEMWVDDGERTVKIVFSGDLGPVDTVVERPPAVVESADFVVIESTYGDREHKGIAETREEFRKVLAQALEDGGKILIPTFAVDRAQRILYELRRLQDDPAFAKMPKIYFDSPMGTKATKIYEKYVSLLSREMQDIARGGESPFAPRGMTYTGTSAESRAINDVPSAIVLAGSGMCSGGRIVHHLKHNLWSEKCHVLFVGYQAHGTLGRRLVDGERGVRIAGEEVTVRANLHTLGGFSAHGGRSDLLEWTSHFARSTSFFVVHGEKRSSEAFRDALRGMGFTSVAPMRGASYDLKPSDAALAPSAQADLPRQSDHRTDLLDLLDGITSAAESLRDSIDEIKDPREIMPLLESTCRILESARGIGRR